MKRSQLLLLIIVLVVPIGIAATSPGVDDGLAAKKWRLTSFGPIETPTSVIEGTTITLEFSRDGKLGGNGGCNSYGGDYQIGAESLSLSRIISTKRACMAQNAMQQEQRAKLVVARLLSIASFIRFPSGHFRACLLIHREKSALVKS